MTSTLLQGSLQGQSNLHRDDRAVVTYDPPLQRGEKYTWPHARYPIVGVLASDEDRGVLSVTAIDAGEAYSCGIVSDGSLLCWGDIDGGTDVGPLFMPLPAGRSVVHVSGSHAVLDNGSVLHMSMGNKHSTSGGTSVSPQVGQVFTFPGGVKATKVEGVTDNSVCALLDNGSVACWGVGSSGQLGNGAFDDSLDTPIHVQLPSGSPAVDVSAGGAHACAVLQNGSVYCWGSDTHGRLGYGGGGTSATPVQVLLAEGELASSVSAGLGHTCIVLTSGMVKCWGSNNYRQAGGTAGSYNAPFTPVGLAGLRATTVSAGISQTCAVFDDGNAWCWGRSAVGSGQTYGNWMAGGTTPVQVVLPEGRSAVDISAGGWAYSIYDRTHSCALLDDANVYCWGRGSEGQAVGGLLPEATNLPESVNPTNLIRQDSGENWDLSVLIWDNEFWASTSDSAYGSHYKGWDLDWDGGDWDDFNWVEGSTTWELHYTETGNFELHLNGVLIATSLDSFSGPQNILVATLDAYTVHTPIPVFSKMPIDASLVAAVEGLDISTPEFTEITFDNIDAPTLDPLKILESGADHTCVIEEHGDIYCWGEGSYGRLGQGSQTDSTPVKVNYPEPFISVDAGYQTTCGITTAKRLVCWGNNGGHQVDMTETGSTAHVYAPVLTTALRDTSIYDVSLAWGTKNTCFITDVERELYCMGTNSYGQIGAGSTASVTEYEPVHVMMPDRVADVDLGATHACAVLENADLYCWGNGYFGRVGHGSGSFGTEVGAPDLILSDVKQVSAGYDHTCAVLNDGRIACWGEGGLGR